MAAFLPALEQEIHFVEQSFCIEPQTVFWGGGTPSALSIKHLTAIEQFWPWKKVPEFTLEANPMTISSRKAEVLQQLGVNRISLGVQAFDEASLQLLGRTHRAQEVAKTVQRLRRSGFANINIDLMFALPGQSMGTWKSSVQQALELEPDHISLYELTYEEDTEFLERLHAGKLMRETTGAEMHRWAIEELTQYGFIHYEVSNFAKPGKEAQHNQACWAGEDYLGLGPSACSTVGHHRWKTVADIGAYAEDPLSREWELLDPEIRQQEKLMLGLRTNRGIDRTWVRGKDDFLSELEKQSLLQNRHDRIILTSRGLLVADTITEELL